MASFEPVRAILRGLDILRIISESGPLVATEISKRAGLPQPTTVRIIETLIDAGYVYREPNSASYGVTARTLVLSRGFNSASRLVQLAQPLVEGLRSEIGWPSNLSTFDGDSMTVAYTNRSAHGMSIPGRLGAGIPLLATATGLVYLAHLPIDERDAVVRSLDKSKNHWDNDPDIRAKLGARLAAAKRDGCAFADERYLAEIYNSRIWAVAVPVIAGDRVIAGLSSLMLHDAGPRKRILAKVLPPLRRTANAIAQRVLEDGGLVDQIRAPSGSRGKARRSRRKQ